MRVNVYYEEMTNETIMVTKTADTGQTFYGARIFLATPTALHYHSGDDDRPAVTFWYKNESDAKGMIEALHVASHHART